MPEHITIGELLSSGTLVGTRYQDPFVRADAQNTITINRDKIADDIYLVVPVRHIEATALQDNAYFTMVVYDNNNNVLDTITQTFDDRWGWGTRSWSSMAYRISASLFQNGHFPMTKTYRCHIEVRLDVSSWSGSGSSAGIHYVLQDSKDVNVVITVQKPNILSIYMHCNPNGTSISWKDNYILALQCSNVGNKRITNIGADLREDDLSVSGNENNNIVIESYTGGALDPSESTEMCSVSICKDWAWWTEAYLEFSRQEPYEKSFKYSADIEVTCADRFNDTYTRDLTVKVTVEEEKKEYADLAQDFYYEVIAGYAVLAISIGCTLAFGVGAPAAAIAAAAIGIAYHSAGESKRLAKDPPEYDRNYKKLHDYTKLVKPLIINVPVPNELKTLAGSLNNIYAINQSSGISLSRYLSAQKHGNTTAKNLQKKHSKELLKKAQEEAFILQQNFPTVQRIIKQENIGVIKLSDPEYAGEVEKIKNNGFSDSYKTILNNFGFESETITEVEESIKKTDIASISFDPEKTFSNLKNVAFNSYLNIARNKKIIDEFETKPKDTLYRELLRDKMISVRDFRNKMKTVIKGDISLISEIKAIGEYFEKKLALVKIKTTFDLLQKCGKPAGLKRIACSTGISDKLLKEWVSIADLMRLKGIGDDYAYILVKLGVDSVVKLSKANSEGLLDKIKKYVEDKPELKNKVPSKTQINNWINTAKSD